MKTQLLTLLPLCLVCLSGTAQTKLTDLPPCGKAAAGQLVANNLLLLLGSQSYADIDDRQGKDRLRERAREEINRVLTDQGLPGEVEAVYFTSFVVQ